MLHSVITLYMRHLQALVCYLPQDYAFHNRSTNISQSDRTLQRRHLRVSCAIANTPAAQGPLRIGSAHLKAGQSFQKLRTDETPHPKKRPTTANKSKSTWESRSSHSAPELKASPGSRRTYQTNKMNNIYMSGYWHNPRTQKVHYKF